MRSNPNSPGNPPLSGVDLIILGGGCAGLSLAARLASQAPRTSVCIVEPRTAYVEDRTWCGWRLRRHLFDDCAVQQWRRWRVKTPNASIERGSNRYPYQMIRSDLFYEKAINAIAHSQNCFFRRGVLAETLTETETVVEVRLSDGSTVHAPWVIDTRPALTELKPPWLWQNFVGFVVRQESLEAHGFGEIPTLMDFQSPGDSVAKFMYILPIDDSHCLYEWTEFSSALGRREEIEANLKAWIDRRLGQRWSIERRENGSLPMGLAPRSTSTRVIAAGTRGGSMRASTGYAFHAIQRWADACSTSIATNGMPIPPQQDRLLEFMDTVFMHAIQRPTASAAKIFGDLFAGTAPDSLVRFLAGSPEVQDFWPMMRSLPWATFLAAIPSAVRTQWAR